VLRDELAACSGVEIVGEAANGNDALRGIARLKPDLVLPDLQMPPMEGFDVIRSLPAGDLPVVIIVTAHGPVYQPCPRSRRSRLLAQAGLRNAAIDHGFIAGGQLPLRKGDHQQPQRMYPSIQE
jgi:CheY-like chemotaxis protein